MTTTPKGITTNLLPQLLELLAASKSLMAQVDRKRYNIRKDFDFFLADAAVSGAIARAEAVCAAPTTGTEIGDRRESDSSCDGHFASESDLEQLSDPWHSAGHGIIRDSNGLAVTTAQILRCKIERDNLDAELRDLRECSFALLAALGGDGSVGDASEALEKAAHSSGMTLDDIDRHEDGL